MLAITLTFDNGAEAALVASALEDSAKAFDIIAGSYEIIDSSLPAVTENRRKQEACEQAAEQLRTGTREPV